MTNTENTVHASEVAKGVDIKLLCWSVDPSGFYAGYIPCFVDLARRGGLDKLVLLNAMVPGDKFVMYSYRISIDDAVKLIQLAKKIESYIGHKSTAELLSKLSGREIQVNRGEYQPSDMDVALIARLRKRQQTPGDVAVAPDDLELLEFFLVNYAKHG